MACSLATQPFGFALALVRCDNLFVSTEFAGTYANQWKPAMLRVVAGASPDQVVVEGHTKRRVVELFRMTVPDDCGQPVAEVVGDAEVDYDEL